MVIHVATWSLAEVAYLSTETDHGENAFLGHVRSEYSVENFDGFVVNVVFCRNSSKIGDSKRAAVFGIIDHTSFHKAVCFGAD